MTAMSIKRTGAILLGCAALTACGGAEPAPEPVEQIVVSKPGAEKAFSPALTDGRTLDTVAAGEAAFAACTACHVAKAGAASMAGPNLHGVFGRKAGALGDFQYSEALAGSNIVWNQTELDAYIADPAGNVAGTIMVAGAVGDSETRAAIIAYLQSLSS